MVFVAQGPGDGLLHAAGSQGKSAQGGRIGDHGVMPNAVDQLAADSGIDGGDQTQPQAREPRRQHRRLDHPAPQFSLSGVFLHQLRIGHHIPAADFEHLAPRTFEVRRGHQVLHHVLDGDGLSTTPRPPRRDHDRQFFHQGPDQFEGKTARADDDRSAKLDGQDPRLPQQAADFLAAAEVRRKGRAATQSTQIDDPPHARLAGRLGKVAGRFVLLFLEPPVGRQGVNQVIGGVDARQGLPKRGGVEYVAGQDLGGGHRPGLEKLRPPAQAPQAAALLLQNLQQAAADVAARPGQE